MRQEFYTKAAVNSLRHHLRLLQKDMDKKYNEVKEKSAKILEKYERNRGNWCGPHMNTHRRLREVDDNIKKIEALIIENEAILTILVDNRTEKK